MKCGPEFNSIRYAGGSKGMTQIGI